MNTYIGIDYHKHYSIASAIDEQGRRLAEVRMDGNTSEGFRLFFNQLVESRGGAVSIVTEWFKVYHLRD